MGEQQMTPSKVVTENIKVYMRWRNLRQEDVAERMTVIGAGFNKKKGGKTAWYRRTVGQMLNGHRRIDVDELFDLAVALETTVGALLSPHVGKIVNFDAAYRIADLVPLSVLDFEILLQDLPERHARPRLVLSGLPTRTDPLGDLHWVKEKNETEQALVVAIDAFKLAHPEIDVDTASGREIFAIIEDDIKGDRIKD